MRKKTMREIWYKLLDNFLYYEVKVFLKNLPYFVKQAWVWRDYDYVYTIDSFADNLERLAKALKSDTHSRKKYRRCMTAAGLLRKAYSDSTMIDDKSYINWTCNNIPCFSRIVSHCALNNMVELTYKRKYPLRYSDNMYKLIHRRIDKVEKERKKEAWAYIHKYIEHFWD